MPATKERAAEIRELEELWAAPTAGGREKGSGVPATRSALDRLPPVPGAALIVGWVAFLVAVIVFEPASEPNAVTPLWADLVVFSFLIALFGALAVGRRLATAGFTLATVAGALGMAISVGCAATDHHLGSWWLVELGATGALTAAAAVGLAARMRRN